MNLYKKMLLGATAFVIGSAAFSQDVAWEQVVDAAKREGKVVLYTSRIGSPYHIAVAKAFEKRYGINVDILEARGTELRERIRTEQVSGRVLGDITQNGSSVTQRQLAEGVLQAHGALPNTASVKPEFRSDGMLLRTFVMSSGILVNTRLVKPQDEPKSWKDLLDPKWRGKILSDDLRVAGSGMAWVFGVHDAFGPDFLKNLSQQELVFSRDLGNDMRRVARGEYPVYVPALLPEVVPLKGLPIKVILPAEGSPFSRFDLAMLKGAPHPNAARLLMNFFLSKEAQLIYVKGGNTPVVQIPASDLEGDAKRFAEVKPLGQGVDADRMDSMLQMTKQIFKQP